MIQDIENGKVKATAVKDISRLGRDYLKVGYFSRIFFPDNDVLLFATNDGLIVPRAIITLHCFTICSMTFKRRIRVKNPCGIQTKWNVWRTYRHASIWLYKKSWIIDKPAAEIVKKLYALTEKGLHR